MYGHPWGIPVSVETPFSGKAAVYWDLTKQFKSTVGRSVQRWKMVEANATVWEQFMSKFHYLNIVSPYVPSQSFQFTQVHSARVLRTFRRATTTISLFLFFNMSWHNVVTHTDIFFIPGGTDNCLFEIWKVGCCMETATIESAYVMMQSDKIFMIWWDISEYDYRAWT